MIQPVPFAVAQLGRSVEERINTPVLVLDGAVDVVPDLVPVVQRDVLDLELGIGQRAGLIKKSESGVVRRAGRGRSCRRVIPKSDELLPALQPRTDMILAEKTPELPSA
ncbi:hypothetical protein AB0L13_24935 [Saccharopolyspora shandongensis]|uniref:hypothetical protein n=1 Tax=Saccharopolyspora shandongensis TaxID=418495 RepID=UPI003412FE2E